MMEMMGKMEKPEKPERGRVLESKVIPDSRLWGDKIHHLSAKKWQAKRRRDTCTLAESGASLQDATICPMAAKHGFLSSIVQVSTKIANRPAAGASKQFEYKRPQHLVQTSLLLRV